MPSCYGVCLFIFLYASTQIIHSLHESVSAVLCRRHFLLFQAHKQYLMKKQATLTIQCYTRGWKVSHITVFMNSCSFLPYHEWRFLLVLVNLYFLVIELHSEMLLELNLRFDFLFWTDDLNIMMYLNKLFLFYLNFVKML